MPENKKTCILKRMIVDLLYIILTFNVRAIEVKNIIYLFTYIWGEKVKRSLCSIHILIKDNFHSHLSF